jgi:hypothetical protein
MRDPELVLAFKALSLRFPPGTLTEQRAEELSKASQEANELVMQRVALGKIELSTLQTLCILTMVDFAGQLNLPLFRLNKV